MKIAVFHNYYNFRGGEDVVFELECDALREQGHTVLPYSIHNKDELAGASPFKKARVAWEAAHNSDSYKKVSEFLRSEKPDIGHVHNWFPLLSPSIYKAHNDAGIPVVQTLHNYRLGCASGNFRRNGKSCNLCKPGENLSAVINRCYRGSLGGSVAWRRMVNQGWQEKTFLERVDHYISPSREIANQHMEMGLPKDKISIIPNACMDPTEQIGYSTPPSGGGAIFIGRLVPEKGVDVLIKAWIQMSQKENENGNSASAPILTIIGTGPEEQSLKEMCVGFPNIRLTGSHLPRIEVMRAIDKAQVLAFPSRWAEPFGLGVIEAMAAGRPVVASNLGGPSEIVDHGVNGLLVPPDDPDALAQAMGKLLREPAIIERMGAHAREKFELNFTTVAHANSLGNLFEKLTS